MRHKPQKHPIYTERGSGDNNNCLKSNIQCIEIRVQWITTDCHKVASVDHLHVEAEMLR